MVHFFQLLNLGEKSLIVVSCCPLITPGLEGILFLSFVILMICIFTLFVILVRGILILLIFQRTNFLLHWFSLLFSCFIFMDCCFDIYYFFSFASFGFNLLFFFKFLRQKLRFIDLSHFLSSNVCIYCYKFSTQHCFGCRSYILNVVFLFLFSSMFFKV